MFTGIIETTGHVHAISAGEQDTRLVFHRGSLDISDVALGDSIAVNGVCLTVVELKDDEFAMDVSSETLAMTTLGKLELDSPVNLEKALALGDRLGGHLVSGHVDGIAEVKSRVPEGRGERFTIQVPQQLRKYISRKGSVCLDGVSLTVNNVSANEFDVLIIPHTQEITIIRHYQAGTRINLEVDLIARYLESLLEGRLPSDDAEPKAEPISREFLAESGFIKE